MDDQSGTNTSCSKECEYMFHECEADAMPGQECRVSYNECMVECDVD